MVKCSIDHPVSSKLVTKRVLSGLAASLIFVSQINQVSWGFLYSSIIKFSS